DNIVCAGEVADVGPALGVVHGIGQVADKDGLLAVFYHLAQAEGPTEHAHVGMHAGEHDMVNASLLEDAPDLVALVADVVAVFVSRTVALFLPGRAGVAALLLEFLGPGLVLGRVVVLAAVGLVDGISAAFFGRDARAPRADVPGQVLGFGDGQGMAAGAV